MATGNCDPEPSPTESTLELLAAVIDVFRCSSLRIALPPDLRESALQLAEAMLSYKAEVEDDWDDFLTGHPELVGSRRPSEEALLDALAKVVAAIGRPIHAKPVAETLLGSPNHSEIVHVGLGLRRLAAEGRVVRHEPDYQHSGTCWWEVSVVDNERG